MTKNTVNPYRDCITSSDLLNKQSLSPQVRELTPAMTIILLGYQILRRPFSGTLIDSFRKLINLLTSSNAKNYDIKYYFKPFLICVLDKNCLSDTWVC